jgi:YidC/Oxa1 family membrane protein insertase
VVFYSHGRQDFPHLWPLAKALAEAEGVGLAYVCATADDPALSTTVKGIASFLLNGDMIRSVFLRTIDGSILVTTLPELGTGPWRRSALMGRYIYVPHSLVSCHMAYRPGAFSSFDEIFCAGSHHATEIRALESHLSGPSKTLFEYGYPRLDVLMRDAGYQDFPRDGSRVLVAPSWGPFGLFETVGVETVAALLSGGCHVIVRPHPETVKRSPQCIRAIVDRFGRDPRVSFEYGIEAYESLNAADVMVSDWSGAAMEFAFGLERPVVFIDTPRKVNNPDYARLGIEPVEAATRGELGPILSTARLDTLPALVQGLVERGHESYAARIRDLRKRYVHNPGSAAIIGARHLKQLLNDAPVCPR